MNTSNFISYNIHGIYHPIKRKKIVSQLKRLNCSVAFLQEIHLNDKEHKKLKRDWAGQVFSSNCGEVIKRGVAILCHRALGFIVDKVFEDKKGHHIMVVGAIGETGITILNLYAPNEDDPRL